MTDVRQSLDSLKTALQAAADTGGGAGQADVNLKFDELAQRRIAKLETAPAPAQPQDDTLANEVAGLRDQLAAATANLQKLESKLEAALAAPKPDAAASAAPQPAPIDTVRIAAQLGALSGTVDQGKPYQAELSALQDTAKLTLNLPALTANATTGIATTAQLKQDLAGLQATLAAGSGSELLLHRHRRAGGQLLPASCLPSSKCARRPAPWTGPNTLPPRVLPLTPAAWARPSLHSMPAAHPHRNRLLTGSLRRASVKALMKNCKNFHKSSWATCRPRSNNLRRGLNT